MRIDNIIWLPYIIDKLAWKHHVRQEEVEETLLKCSTFRKIQKGHIPEEHLYAAFGQTGAGRYLTIFFIYKVSHEALIISARDMSKKERQRYERQ